MRVVKPMHFDFTKLLEGLKRNNVGLAGIKLQAEVSFADGNVEIQPTGQVIPLYGKPPADSGLARLWLNVVDWEHTEKTKLEITGHWNSNTLIK